MSTFLGKEGVVKIGTHPLAEVKSFSVTQTAATVEDTAMGDSWATHKPTIKSWNGSLTCHWDDTDTEGQEVLSIGSEVNLTLFPEGNQSGDYQLNGTAIITSVETQSAHDSLVERTINFQGSGELIIGTTPYNLREAPAREAPAQRETPVQREIPAKREVPAHD